MTEHPSDNRGIDADMSVLTGYAERNTRLADDVGAVQGDLAPCRSIPADLLGDLGDETGLHGELASHIGDLHDHVGRLSTSVGGLGTAVRGAHADYEADEADRARTFRSFEA